MKNKIYQKVLKQVVIFVAALVLLSPGILVAQVVSDHVIELEDYGINVYDVSDGWCETIDIYIGYDLELCTFRSMDEKGKLTGSTELWIYGPEFPYDGLMLAMVDLKGTVKRGGSGNLKVKTVSKGKGTFQGEKLILQSIVKKELMEDMADDYHTWQGTQKIKVCVKGEGCAKDNMPISDEFYGDGDATIIVEAVTGKKISPDASLMIGYNSYDEDQCEYYTEQCELYDDYWYCDEADYYCDDGESLTAKGQTSDKKAETKLNLKGPGKGIKINLTIDETIVKANNENDINEEDDNICTSIKGKIYGQKISYK